jgi:hypothetical protein
MRPSFTIATAAPGTSNVFRTCSTYASKPAGGSVALCAWSGEASAKATVTSSRAARRDIRWSRLEVVERVKLEAFA